MNESNENCLNIEVTRFVNVIIVVALISFFVGLSRIETNPIEKKVQPSTITNKKEIEQMANSYLKVATYSKKGLVYALVKYENCIPNTTMVVVSKLNVDWQEQANNELLAYLNQDGNSEKKIRKFLQRDLFSNEEIQTAIDTINPDWNEQAKIRAEAMRKAGVAEINLKAQLSKQGFRDEEINSVF